MARPKRVCVIESCGLPRVGRGFCRKHYSRWQRHGDPNPLLNREERSCTIEGCEEPHKARGWCGKHYRRWVRYGDPEHLVRLRNTGTLEQRFWARVKKVSLAVTSGCWLWTGYIRRDGYGEFAVDGRMVKAYRWLFEQSVGPVPHGMELDHLCGVRACVRPDHLEVVTHRENILRGLSPAARQARQTQCKRGHAFTYHNTYVSKRGERVCRTCAREAARRRREAKEAIGRGG